MKEKRSTVKLVRHNHDEKLIGYARLISVQNNTNRKRMKKNNDIPYDYLHTLYLCFC